MKKRLWFSYLLTALAGMCFIACSESGQRVYSEIIPGDSDVVAAIQVNRLYGKSGVAEKWETWFGQQQNMEKWGLLVKDGNLSGLDLNKNVYLFFTDNGSKGGMTAKVDDVAKLEKNLETMQQAGTAEILSEKKGYGRAVIGGEVACLFDKNLLLCVAIKDTRENAFRYAEELLKQPSEKNFTKTEGFDKLNAADTDVAFWIAGGSFFANRVVGTVAEINPAGIYILGTVNFEKGKIGLSYEIVSDAPAVKEWLAQNVKIKNRFLDFFPASTVCYFGNAVDGKRVAAQLEKSGLLDQKTTPQDKTEILKAITAFEGDISWGITEFSPLGMPSVLLYAQVKDDFPVKALAQAIRTKEKNAVEVKDTGEGTYEAVIKMLQMSVWFGVKEGVLYLTNDRKLYQNMGKNAQPSFGELTRVAGLKKAETGFLLDVEQILKSPVVQMGIYKIYGYSTLQSKAVFNFLSAFSYAEILGNENTFYLNFYLKDNGQNSLKIIADKGEELICFR